MSVTRPTQSLLEDTSAAGSGTDDTQLNFIMLKNPWTYSYEVVRSVYLVDAEDVPATGDECLEFRHKI